MEKAQKTERWRLILGQQSDPAASVSLSGAAKGMDKVLEALYDSDRKGGLGSSAPNVNRWLGDIRRYFPTPVVQLMQRDALQRLGLERMLLEPELLETIEPDVELVGTLLSLNKQMTDETRASARLVIGRIVKQLEQRLEFPLLPDGEKAPGRETAVAQPVLTDTDSPFVLEIGSEELPVEDLHSALKQLEAMVPERLKALRLDYRSLQVHGTPRRLAVVVQGLASRQTDLETVVKGPPADRAFDADGNPTRAAQGFARGKGVAVGDLTIVAEGDKRYAAAVVREEGLPAIQVLAEDLPAWVEALRFPKSMRWNETAVAYSRPLRWFLALYGPQVVPFTYAGLHSDRVS